MRNNWIETCSMSVEWLTPKVADFVWRFELPVQYLFMVNTDIACDFGLKNVLGHRAMSEEW